MKSDLTPRERILETANELFYTQGYNLTGINQIIDEAKVAKASLYQHFGSKEELGIEYIKKVREDWFEAFEAFLSKNATPEQKIISTFDFLEANMVKNKFKGCRFINLLAEIETTSSQMQHQILEHKMKLRNLFKSLIQEYTQSNFELLIPNSHDTIYLLFEASIIESKIYKDVWPILTAKKTVISILKLTN